MPAALLPERFTTPRLVLRPPTVADAPEIFAAYAQDPEVTRYLTWAPHRSVDETEAYLATCAAGWATGRALTWVLTRPDDGVPLGMFALRADGFRADLGYVLARPFWGQGLMVEAGCAIVEAALALPGMERVWAVCDVDNAASARVLEKLGMQHEGTLRRWIVHPNVSARPRDVHVYARLRPD